MSSYKTTVYGRDVVIRYSYRKPCKGSTDGRHGPKLEPDDPGGIEIDSVEYATGGDVPYSEKLWDELMEEIGEHIYQASLPDC